MNPGTDKWFSPAQVFAQFTTDEGKSSSSIKQRRKVKNVSMDESQATLPEIIQISESGEVTLSPDLAKVHIVCSNTKETADEVKASVNKRVDYILQTFRSQKIGSNCYSVDRFLKRKDVKYYYRVEISVQFTDFTKCQEVSNFLVEKLDTSVDISTPHFQYSPGRLESLRRQSCLLAIHNAKVKALEITRSLNQTLGRARVIREESTEECTGGATDVIEHESNGSFQELLSQATVTVITKVSVSFQLKGKTRKKK